MMVVQTKVVAEEAAQRSDCRYVLTAKPRGFTHRLWKKGKNQE